MISPSTLQFLTDLAQNNQRDWFQAHALEYNEAKKNVLELCHALLNEIALSDPSVGAPEPKRCLFRINRDIRFSNDKSPYKTHFGMLLNALGTKAKIGSGYYFHIQPGASFVSCGVYAPPSDVLRKVRQNIYENWEEFEALLHPKATVAWSDLYRNEDTLKRVPNGFPKDHPSANHLTLKHFYLAVPLSDKEICSPDIVKKATAHFRSMQPFNQFIQEALREE